MENKEKIKKRIQAYVNFPDRKSKDVLDRFLDELYEDGNKAGKD